MSTNTLFIILLVCFALVACRYDPKTKCFVEVEVEYEEVYDDLFNHFSEMFDDHEKEKDKIEKLPEETGISNEEEEGDFIDEDDEYAKVEQLIPEEMKKDCNTSADTAQHQEYMFSHFKKISNRILT